MGWPTRLQLNRDERDILADAAHVLRFGDDGGETTTPIEAEQLLVPRRHDDRADDLWTVWNVVQENAVKGGLRGISRDDLGRPRRMKSRAVNGIDQDIKLNKAVGDCFNQLINCLTSPHAINQVRFRTLTPTVRRYAS